MGGKPCIRGMRITVGAVVGMLSAGRSAEEILASYPALEAQDIGQALAYESQLCAGALVVIDELRSRVRILPIAR